MYMNSNSIPPIMIINRIYENQNLLSLWLVSFLVGLRTYQHPCINSVACYMFRLPIMATFKEVFFEGSLT